MKGRLRSARKPRRECDDISAAAILIPKRPCPETPGIHDVRIDQPPRQLVLDRSIQRMPAAGESDLGQLLPGSILRRETPCSTINSLPGYQRLKAFRAAAVLCGFAAMSSPNSWRRDAQNWCLRANSPARLRRPVAAANTFGMLRDRMRSSVLNEAGQSALLAPEMRRMARPLRATGRQLALGASRAFIFVRSSLSPTPGSEFDSVVYYGP